MGAKSRRKTAKRKTAKRAARKTTKRRTVKRKTAKRAVRKTKGRAAAKRTKKRKGAKRKPSAAFMKPMQPDTALSAVVGSKPIPRTEITKKLWAYIRRKGLQDKSNRRMINADANLRPVFNGRSQVSMFEMTKLVNRHLK